MTAQRRERSARGGNVAEEPTVGESLAYSFTAGHSLGADDLSKLLGGKGASLVGMTAAGLPVPPGFTLTTAACRRFLADGWSADFDEAITKGVAELETVAGKQLGSIDAPLLLSVRSGAETSMPGMMDTVLNVGMNQVVEHALAELTGSSAFAADTHRRALLAFAEIVLGAPRAVLEEAATAVDPEGVGARLQAVGFAVPQDPMTQVTLATKAVFESWVGKRAETYRQVEMIDGGRGTAATIQAMVFGNLGRNSGTGVAFSRNPTTGESGLIGDFMVQAQGEDVVAGGAVTEPLIEMADRWPELYRQLSEVAGTLEARYEDMVDIEFTVEQGTLWLLQARRGKRSPIAALRIAIDLAEDAAFDVDRAEAATRCLRYLDEPPTVADSDNSDSDDRDESDNEAVVVASGLGASPGVASGVLCFDPDRAVELHDQGVSVILARRETSPADVHGMAASLGLFTTLGGQVSHAALVAREWGIPAVVGAATATIADGILAGPDRSVAEGETVTVDGDAGRLLLGTVVLDRKEAPEVAVIRQWAEAAGIEPTERAGAASEPDGLPATGDAVATGSRGAEGTQDPDARYPPMEFRVLHALRIKGMVTEGLVSAICEASVDQARAGLDALVVAGSATFMEPRHMWLITPDGRAAHPDALAEVVGDLDLSALPYQRFLELNDDFKLLCTDWQVRDGEPNNHTDAAYDAGIAARLVALDDLAQPVVSAIGSIATWMAQYGGRLAEARGRFVSGDAKGLTGVMCESYHDVWMELHEDLILTQGIDRAAEGST